ncbi:hypothetical protein D6833_14050 [Candidatus Parcubacteria bacterium]|nr:MAG: hypothetical protein D6833_14050 [Candidatus Parcubacteria bacterium]
MNLDSPTVELVKPEEYIRLYERHKETIRSARVIPPRPGENGFGWVEIVTKTPTPKLRWTRKR